VAIGDCERFCQKIYPRERILVTILRGLCTAQKKACVI
jgi:hypothetical protein